jgi:hypothetical protein
VRALRASSEAELSPILDHVHDRSYDLSSLDHNARNRTLTVTLAVRSSKKGPRRFWLFRKEATTVAKLVIHKALGFKVVDDARIGKGDINTIRQKNNQVVIVGGIPVKVLVDVEGFDIELLLPDDAALA